MHTNVKSSKCAALLYYTLQVFKRGSMVKITLMMMLTQYKCSNLVISTVRIFYLVFLLLYELFSYSKFSKLFWQQFLFFYLLEVQLFLGSVDIEDEFGLSVRNLHFLYKNSTLISRENYRFFWGRKIRENVAVLDFLAVDNFDFTRKVVKKKF